MCLQSMPSVCICLFVNTMIQGIFCSVAVLCQASYCFKKTKPLLSQILTLRLPSIDIAGNDAGWQKANEMGSSLLQSLCIHCQCQSHGMAAILWWVCVTTSQINWSCFSGCLSSFEWHVIHIVLNSSKTWDRQHMWWVNMCLFIIIIENNSHLGLDMFCEGHCSL